MRTEGSIEQNGLSEVLLVLGREGRTGILTIQGRDEIIAFAFLEGGIVSADALNQTMEDGLGQVLSERGLIRDSEFAELASEYQAGGGQVVDLLVERGFVQRSELLEAVRGQTYKLCKQALGWTHGDFKFYQGEEVSYEEGIEPLSPEELLIRVGRDLNLDLLPGGVPAGDSVYRRSQSAAATSEPGAGGLDDLDEAAFTAFKLIDGKRTLAELARESGVSEYRVAYLLNRWQDAGMIERLKRSRARRPTVVPSAEPEALEIAPSAESSPPRRESRLAAWWAARKEVRQPDAIPWPSRILGLALVALFVASFWTAPERVLLPFPWQQGIQEGFERERAIASLARLRRANSAHFLLHGRFAEDLSDLATGKLLPAADLEDLNGQPLIYSATAASYVVRSSIGMVPERETFLQETIRGNFLLDPEVEPPAESRRALLVLLD